VGGSTKREQRIQVADKGYVTDYLVAYHLAPAITDFILDENRDAAITNLNRHQRCCAVNGIKR